MNQALVRFRRGEPAAAAAAAAGGAAAEAGSGEPAGGTAAAAAAGGAAEAAAGQSNDERFGAFGPAPSYGAVDDAFIAAVRGVIRDTERVLTSAEVGPVQAKPG